MALTKGIHFRHLFEQLTQSEGASFLSNLVDSHMETLLTCLFEYCVHHPNKHKTILLNTLNASISDIIHSREEKPNAISPSNMKLHQLPKAMIGFTASFLTQTDYCSFSECSRAIYLGCNSPNLLTMLNLYEISPTHYSSISPTHY
eukprot:411430_1